MINEFDPYIYLSKHDFLCIHPCTVCGDVQLKKIGVFCYSCFEHKIRRWQFCKNKSDYCDKCSEGNLAVMGSGTCFVCIECTANLHKIYFPSCTVWDEVYLRIDEVHNMKRAFKLASM